MSLEEVLNSQTETTRIRCPVCADSRRKTYEKTMGVMVEEDRVVYQCLVLNSQTETTRIRCPVCADSRRKTYEKTMGVMVEEDRVVYQCFHCGTSGAMRKKTFMQQVHNAKATPKHIDPPTEHIPQIVIDFLVKRSINPEIANQFPLVGSEKYFAGIGRSPAIGFVYGDPRQPEAIKWRSTEDKEFTQQGSARSLFGLNQLPKDITELVICEGEMDVLALASAGIPAVSVPNGAPAKVTDGKVDPKQDGGRSQTRRQVLVHLGGTGTHRQGREGGLLPRPRCAGSGIGRGTR